MNKWDRSQSPSAIPRLLRRQPIYGSADSISRSPSPVKPIPGSKLPTPTLIQRAASTPNLKQDYDDRCSVNISEADESSVQHYNETSNIEFAEKELSFGEPLEEIFDNEAERENSDKSEVLDVVVSKQNEDEENNWLLCDDSKIEPFLQESFLDESGEIEREMERNFPEEEDDFLKKVTKDNVLYITENLIKRVTKTDDIKSLTKLNLSIAKQWKRKIQFIENLDKLSNLRKLNLSNNFIQKIQKLQPLINLRYLDLSMNQIKSVEGLDHLEHLECLYLDYNEIESFPSWFGKKMNSLQTFSISNNKFRKLDEFTKLSGMNNLSLLDIRDNPCCRLNHLESFVVYHLRTLNTINGKVVCTEMRKVADQRFCKEELIEREKLIEELRLKNSELEMQNKQSFDKTQIAEMEKKMTDKIKALKRQLHTQSQDLELKNNLLENKTTELSRACEKQYKLEQELAFYKLDAKFDEMWKMPNDHEIHGEANGFTENAYIGKARYKANSIAKENIILNDEQSFRFASFVSRMNTAQFRENEQICTALEDALEIDLSDYDSNTQIKQLKRKLENKTKEVENLKGSITDLEVKIQDKERKLRDKDEEIKDLRCSIEDASKSQQEKEEMFRELSKAEEMREYLQTELSDLNSLLDESNTELIKRYQVIRDLTQQLDKAKETEKEKEDLTEQLKISNKNAKDSALKLAELICHSEELKKIVKEDELKISELTDHNERLSKACDEFSRQLELDKQKLSELREKLKENQKKVKSIDSKDKTILALENDQKNLLGKLNEMKKALEESKILKANYEHLLSEYQDVQHTLQAKDTERNCVFDFVKSLMNDTLLSRSPQQPNKLKDKSMQAVLTNLRNTISDYIQSHNDLKQSLTDSQLKMKDMMDNMEELEKENTKLKESVQKLKETMDMKESAERVQQSDITALKEHYKQQEEKNLQSLKEYDEIANEMRQHLERLEQENATLKTDLEERIKKAAREKSTRKNLEQRLKDNVSKVEHHTGATRKELDQANEDNKELKASLEANRKEASFWQNQVKKTEQDFTEKMNVKEKEYNEEMEKLLDELKVTKNYIAALQKDLEDRKKDSSQYIGNLTKNMEEMENEMERLANEKQDVNELFDEIKEIKSTLQNLKQEINMKTPNSYDDLRNKLNILEAKLSTKMEEKNENTAVKDMNRSLQKTLKQVEKFKEMLQEKCSELERSNIPENIRLLQREEMKNSLEELKRKEDAIKHLTKSNEYHRNNIRSRDVSPTSCYHDVTTETEYDSLSVEDEDMGTDKKHVTFNDDDTMSKPYVIHHRHWFDSTKDETSLSEHIIPETGRTSKGRSTASTFNESKTSERLYREMDRLSKGRDNLRWELNRLEAKVGDAMLRRSLYRRQIDHY